MKKQIIINRNILLFTLMLCRIISAGQINFQLGTAEFYDKGNYSGAIYWLDKSIETEPETQAEAYAIRGLSKSYLKDYENGFNDLEAARRMKPKDPKILASISLNFTLQGKYNQSLPYIDSAITIDSADGQLWDERATVYSMLTNYHLAIENSKVAIRLAPDVCLDFINLGYFYFATGDYNDAMVYYNKALALNPTLQEEVKLLVNRATCSTAILDYENTIKNYEQIATIAPRLPVLYIKIGEAELKLHRQEGACIDFNKAKEINDSIGTMYLDKYCNTKPGAGSNGTLRNEIKLSFQLKTESVDSAALIIYTNTDAQDNQAIPYTGKNTELELSLNSNYVLRFVKAGYISQQLYVDTHIPAGREKELFATIAVTAELQKEKTGETSTTDKQMGGVKYNKSKKEFGIELIK